MGSGIEVNVFLSFFCIYKRVLMGYGLVFGVFGAIGIHNLRAMQEMMTGQTLEYVFPYSKFSFPTDVAFLVVCEGSRSAFFQVCTPALFFPHVLRFRPSYVTLVLFVLTVNPYFTDEHQHPPPICSNLPSRPIQIRRSSPVTAPSKAGDVQEFGVWCEGGECKSRRGNR